MLYALLLMLLHAVTVASSDYSNDPFINHIKQYKDDNVNPCDDFFRHICPADFPEENALMGIDFNEYTEEATTKMENLFQDPELKKFEKRLLSVSSKYTRKQYPRFLAALHDRSLLLLSLSEKGILSAEEQRSVSGDVENMRVLIRKQIQDSDYSKIAGKELRDITDDLLVMVGFQEERIASAQSYKKWQTIELYKNFVELVYNNTIKSYDAQTITDEGITTELIKMGLFFEMVNPQLFMKILVNGLVNAFYNKPANAVSILDGLILLTRNSSQAVKAGTVMMSIAHEIHHGLFNEYLSVENETNYQVRRNCLVSHMEAVCDEYKEAGCHSGNVTFSEDSSDLEGMQAAYLWMEQELGNETAPVVQNTTNEQLFFYSFGSMFCSKQKDSEQIREDVHSTDAARINGILSLMPSFKRAFKCTDNNRMMKLALRTTEHCNFFGSEVR